MKSRETNDGRFLKGVNDPVDNVIEPVHNSQSGLHVITPTLSVGQQFSVTYPASEQLLVRTLALSHCVFSIFYTACLIVGTYAGINTWLLTLALLIAYGLWITGLTRCGQFTNHDCPPRWIERSDDD